MRIHLLLPPTLALSFLVSTVPLSAQEYYADIRPVLSQNCLSCHTAEGPGWSMEDPVETYEQRHRLAAMILARQMPPWIAEEGHQSYVDDPSLDREILELVRSWRDEGFPLGEPRPDPTPEAPAVHGHGAGPFQPDLTLDVLPPDGYLPNQTRTDDYRCFVVDWTDPEPGYITGFRAAPGNLLVAHHVVVHAISPEMVHRFRELEDEEAGAGYQCFGGALPDRLGQRAQREAYQERYPDGIRELSRSSFWLAHWAPGMDGHHFPQGSGIRMEPGSGIVVQMHYYGSEAPGERDAGTRMDFQVAREVEKPAFHLPQTLGIWLNSERNGTMVIEPGRMATYRVSDLLGDFLPYVTRVTGVEEERIGGLEVHSANLHMHAFGHSGVISLVDPAGRKEVLLSVPRWDLRWQRDFTFDQPKVFQRDELDRTEIAVECTFHNTTHDTVYGGYGSFDEMCFNFSYIAVQRAEPEVADEAGAEPEVADGVGAEPEVADETAQASVRTLTPVQPDRDSLRILVYHDMEGLSGQDDPNTFRFSHPERYPVGRAALMADLNAVIEGLVAGGAQVVHVVDGHGSGNPLPDVVTAELHPAAQQVIRNEPFDAYTGLVADSDYDAVAVVGMHAKTGSRGFASHTFTLGIAFHLNGMAVTETELVGYSWGRAGVPLIFASGDDRLAHDLAEPMPWVEYVTVKTATSASTADLRPVEEARADLTAGAQRAVERLLAGEMQAQRLAEPVTAVLQAVPPADVSVLRGVPGIAYSDGTVTFQAADFQGAYDGLVSLVNVARTGYASVMMETAREEVGEGFGALYSDSLFTRWLDFESGRWAPPPPAPVATGERYHGYR